MFDFVMDGRDVGQRAPKTFFCSCSTRNATVDIAELSCIGKKKKLPCIEFERHCSMCGTKLSIYNMSDICYLCQEKMSAFWKERNWRWSESDDV